jgi:hypothetical protein
MEELKRRAGLKITHIPYTHKRKKAAKIEQKNRIEMFNELFVVLAGVFLPSFTEMTKTLELQT